MTRHCDCSPLSQRPRNLHQPRHVSAFAAVPAWSGCHCWMDLMRVVRTSVRNRRTGRWYRLRSIQHAAACVSRRAAAPITRAVHVAGIGTFHRALHVQAFRGRSDLAAGELHEQRLDRAQVVRTYLAIEAEQDHRASLPRHPASGRAGHPRGQQTPPPEPYWTAAEADGPWVSLGRPAGSPAGEGGTRRSSARICVATRGVASRGR